MFYLISYMIKKSNDSDSSPTTTPLNDDGNSKSSIDIEAVNNASKASNPSEEASTPSFLEQLKQFLWTLFDWLTLILMLVLPGLTSYTIGYAVAFGVGVLVLCSNAYSYSVGTVKIFPKVWELGLITVNLAMLIYEATAKPSFYWSKHWSGLIVNMALLGLILITIAIGKPFTMDFAKEKVKEDLWESPVFRSISYTITYVWALQFALDILFGFLYVYVAPDNEALHIAPNLVVLFLALYFTKKYPEYARAQRMKLAAQVQH